MGANRGRAKAVMVVVAVVVTVSLLSFSFADGGGKAVGSNEMMAGSSAESIERRLEALEKLVGSSRRPVSERIDILEGGLRDLTQAMGGTGWSSVKSNIREAKKTLAEVARQRQQQAEDLRKLSQVGKRLEQISDDLAKLDSLAETPFSAKSPPLSLSPGPLFLAIWGSYG